VEDSLFEFLLLHSVFIVGEILIFGTLLHMLYQRRTPTSMIAWLLFLIALPYIAVLLYFLIGIRKQPDNKNKSFLHLQNSGAESAIEVNTIDGILRSNGIAGVTQHNSFRLITDPQDAYMSMLDEIEKAEESISISTYVFKDDETTQGIIAALARRAREGLRVRLLIDSLGSYRLYFFQSALQPLKDAGGEVHFFMPLLRLPYRNYINLRNHRKIYLFDEQRLLSGGMNLSAEYMGREKCPDQWEDLLFLSEGEATYQYAQIFEDDWAYATAQPLRLAKRPDTDNSHGDAYMQVVPSGPDIKGDALYEALISAIHTAKQRIWIVTPYFVPDESLSYALKIAKHKGVDVKLITPKTSNHLIADLSRSSYMRELQENGIDLVLYKGNMLHAKAILFDDLATMIGSVNIDNRSLLLNYEVVSFAYSESIISDIETWMERFISDADHQMPEASKGRRIIENFMRILAPQL